MAPVTILSLVIGSIYSAVFHLIYGNRIKDLAVFIIAGIIGFWLGQIAAAAFNWHIFTIGTIHIFEASVASVLALYLSRWLNR